MTMTCTATYVVVAGDLGTNITNTATADSDQTPTTTDSNTVPVPQPTLAVVKSNNSLGGFIDADSSGDVSAGDTLTYTYVVTNTGTANLTNVTLGDVNNGAGTLGAITCLPVQPASLAPAATMTCTATYVVAAGDLGTNITNTATADSTQTPSTTDSNTVPVPNPSLAVVKSNNSAAGFIDADSSGDVSAGDTLTYTYVVTNTGTANLTNVTLGDVNNGAGTLGAITCLPVQPASLAPAATMTCTATYVVAAGDLGTNITNTATADSTQTPSTTDSNTVPVPQPSLAVVKSNNSAGGFIDADSSGDVSAGHLGIIHPLLARQLEGSP